MAAYEPSEEEVLAFFAANPSLFGQRKLDTARESIIVILRIRRARDELGLPPSAWAAEYPTFAR
jgi:hypothetical protein